jgi:hypothetical protein
VNRDRYERRLLRGDTATPPKGELRAVKLIAKSTPGFVGISLALENGKEATFVASPDIIEAWLGTLLEVIDNARAGQAAVDATKAGTS